MIDEFAKKFRNENKKVDLNLMLEKYLHLFPETALPKPKEKKKPKSPKDGKLSPKGEKLSLSSKKSGKSSLRSSLPKSTEGEKTSLRKSKEEVRGSQTTSLTDEKRESGQGDQPEQVKVVEESAVRTSLDVEPSRKRVSFVINNVDEPDVHIEDLVTPAVDETENIVKDDAVSEHGVEDTTDTEAVTETSTTANTLETDSPAIVDDSLVVDNITTTQSVDNNTPNEDEQNTENVSTIATKDPQS